jgi:hypothetical protein
MGIAGKFKIEGGIEQVEAEGFGKNLLQPGAFARPPRTKQEKRSIGALEQTVDSGLAFHFHSAYDIVNLQCKFTTYWHGGQAHFQVEVDLKKGVRATLEVPCHSLRMKIHQGSFNSASPSCPLGARKALGKLNFDP